MLPAGLGIVCASQKALSQYDQAKLPRCFFDFGDMRKANATGYFPYTPSLPMLYGLRESLAMLLEEGLENVFARHHRLAEGTRAGGEGVGARALRQGAEVALRHGQRHHGAGGRQRGRGDRRRLPPLQPGAGRRPRADGRPALPHRPPGRPQRADAGRRDRRRGDGDAGRGDEGHAGQRSRRGAGVLAQHREAAGEARAPAARARCPAPAGRARRRRRPRPARLDEPHPLRAGPRAAAAQRAGGAGLPARAVRRRRSTARRTRLPRSRGCRRAGATRSRPGSNVDRGSAGA